LLAAPVTRATLPLRLLISFTLLVLYTIAWGYISIIIMFRGDIKNRIKAWLQFMPHP
jgi:hypothetical protein